MPVTALHGMPGLPAFPVSHGFRHGGVPASSASMIWLVTSMYWSRGVYSPLGLQRAALLIRVSFPSGFVDHPPRPAPGRLGARARLRARGRRPTSLAAAGPWRGTRLACHGFFFGLI